MGTNEIKTTRQNVVALFEKAKTTGITFRMQDRRVAKAYLLSSQTVGKEAELLACYMRKQPLTQFVARRARMQSVALVVPLKEQKAVLIYINPLFFTARTRFGQIISTATKFGIEKTFDDAELVVYNKTVYATGLRPGKLVVDSAKTNESPNIMALVGNS